ncbi:MAG: sigma-70 family RNA polymerase sigma factor [Christensenellales bacterium]
METVTGPDSKEKRIEHMISLYQLPLLRLCIMYLHDEEQAKDAVQETFIKAYRNLDSFRADSSEKTATHQRSIPCKNVYRTGWFRYIDRTVTLDMITERPAPAAAEDDELTTEIMNLPVKLREVALLCWLQGMAYEEAAETLGISRQAVGSRLNRARKKLRFALGGSDDYDPA